MKIKMMKRSLAFGPAILPGLFLLNSFVLKENEAKKKPTEKAKSSAMVNIIFKSADGGQTWQDISEGLPEKLQREGVWNGGVFANERGLYLRAGNTVYHSETNCKMPLWTKEVFPGQQRNIAPGKNGILAYDIRGRFLKRTNGTTDWSPMYTNFQKQAVRIDKTMDWMYKNYKEREVRTVFETARGTVLIGSSNSLFRSANHGKTWTQVHVGDGRMKLAESNGILLTTSKNGLLRSADEGENWERVISEGGPGITVERIDGGFAAIIYNAITQTNSLHISLDNGKTWNAIGEELQPPFWSSPLTTKIGFPETSFDILSIKQMGKYLICGRADGLFRSSDTGKTWTKLPVPATGNFGFNLSVSGNLIYVIPNKGC